MRNKIFFHDRTGRKNKGLGVLISVDYSENGR